MNGLRRSMMCGALLAAAACGGAMPAPGAPSSSASGAGATANAPSVGSARIGPPLTSADVDALLRAEWQKRGITPAERTDDARFLRRAWLDIVGVIPPPERVQAFLADAAPDKRARAVSELLASSAYADHWTAVWEDILLGEARAGDLDRAAFHVWLHEQFAKNVPWDRVAHSLLTATGENSTGGPRQRRLAETEAEMAQNPRVSGAVNWALKFRDAPQDFAGSASKIFLGTQIQCAQCHDHKTEKWTQRDFQAFTACFTRVQTVPVGNMAMKGPKVVAVRDLDRPLPRFAKNPDLAPFTTATPKALDGTTMDGNVRQGIARWMTQSPWFARAFVNRMWGHFLGRGFVDPVDDLRPSNPADAPAVLDRIADDFAAHGYDVKRLVALIAGTEAYQLGSAARGAAAENAAPIPLWSRFRVSPLGPEELVNSLLAATGTSDALAKRGGDVDDLRFKLTRMFSFVFDVDEEFDQARYEGTLAQALVLLNGKLTVGGAAVRPGTATFALAHSNLDDRAKIDALYLRTLSRLPTTDERNLMLAYFVRVPSNAAALEDVEWALLNSSEFALNH